MAESTTNEVNSIEVKNQTYQIADKKMRELVETLTTGLVTTPDLNSQIPYSDRTSLKPCSVTSIAQMVCNYGICDTEANNQNKSVTISNFPGLIVGVTTLVIKFNNGNTANDITLTVNDEGPFPIYAANSDRKLQTGSINQNGYLTLHYIGQNWVADTPLVKKTSSGSEFVWD